MYSRVHRQLCEVFMNFHEHFLKVRVNLCEHFAKVHFANISHDASQSVRKASLSGRKLCASQSFLCTLLYKAVSHNTMQEAESGRKVDVRIVYV